MIVTPRDTQLDGQTIAGKIRAVRVDQGHQAKIQWPLRDQTGQQPDLTSLQQPSMTLALQEATQTNRTLIHRLPAQLDVATATASVDLDEVSVRLAGIILGEWIVYDGDPSNNPNLRPVFSERFYIFVDPSHVIEQQRQPYKPPPLQIIRLRLRDSAPADNPLLLDQEFDLAEICDAYLRPVQMFNTERPIITRLFTTMDFPYTDQWTDAIVGELMMTAARFYLRNALPYQAGGIAVNDRETKWQPYLQIGQSFVERFRRFSMAEKRRLSVLGTFGSLKSIYAIPTWW